jgi:hypothetical protein
VSPGEEVARVDPSNGTVVAVAELVEVVTTDDDVVVVALAGLWDRPDEHDAASSNVSVTTAADRARMGRTVDASEGPHWGGPLAARRPRAVDLV